MGQLKSMLKNAMCGGPGNTKDSGSPVASDGEDSETESQYGVYRPLRNNKRDTRDIPLHEFTTDHPRDHACLYNHHRGSHGSRGSRGSATSADGAVGGIHPSNHHAHRCHFFAALQHHPHGHRVRYVCTLNASSQRAFPFFHGKSSLFFIFREKNPKWDWHFKEGSLVKIPAASFWLHYWRLLWHSTTPYQFLVVEPFCSTVVNFCYIPRVRVYSVSYLAYLDKISADLICLRFEVVVVTESVILI